MASSSASTSSSTSGSGGAGGAGGAGGGTCATIGLDHDPSNCGVCGHDCLGGDCYLGACRAVQLATATQPNGIGLDDNNVYWADYGGAYVGRVTKDGKQKAVLAQTTDPTFKPATVAVTADSIYYGVYNTESTTLPNGYVGRVDKASGDLGKWSAGYAGTWAVAADGATVFWANRAGDVSIAWTTGGGKVTTVAPTDVNATVLAVHPSYVFYAGYTPNRIHRLQRDTLKDDEIVKDGAAALGGVDAKMVYWSQSGRIFRAPVDAKDVGAEAVQVGEVVTPVDPSASLSGFVADADGFGYFTVFKATPTGFLRKFRLDGSGSTVTLVDKIRGGAGVATDAKAIYWAEQSGHLRKLAK